MSIFVRRTFERLARMLWLTRQSARERRNGERAEPVMLQPAQVAAEERRAGPACRISASPCGRCPCRRRSPATRPGSMPQLPAHWDAPCRSRGFEPVVALADLSSRRKVALDVHLGRRLGKREVVHAKAHLHFARARRSALHNSSSVHFRWPMWMSRSITRPSIWWNIGVCVWSLSMR